MRVWPVHFNRLDRTAVLRLAAPACGSFGAGLRSADGPQSLAGAQAKTGGSVQDQDARRVVRHHGGYRYLLCADPDHARGAASSAYGGARDFFSPPPRPPTHPHMAAARFFAPRHGVTQPAPAPRFSRTPSAIRDAAKADITELTSEWKAAGENSAGIPGRAKR